MSEKVEPTVSSFLEKSLYIDNYVRDPNKEVKYYISDSGKCHRQRWLKRFGVTTEFDPFVKWILQIGNLYHDWAYKQLEAAGILIQSEDYVSHPHFSGRYDGIVKLDGKYYLMDLKSAGAYKITKTLQGEDDEGYRTQLLTYLMLLEAEGKYKFEGAKIVYINKEPSDQNPVCFLDKDYYLTEWRAKQIRDEMDALVGYWTSGKIPPCTCVGWQKQQKYNSFYHFCNATETKVENIIHQSKKEGCTILSTKEHIYFIDSNGAKREVF